ncbi:MAG: YtxH domain-containing protein [Prevotella sp.]|nr:YtxH domain-containing protein [Prevotella sp.]
MKTLGYISAFLGGALAGAALGLLLAPEAGKDTRCKISDSITKICKKCNIKLTKKEVDDIAEGIAEEV